MTVKDDEPVVLKSEGAGGADAQVVELGGGPLIGSLSVLQDGPRLPSPIRHPIQAGAWFVQACVGLAFLTAILAIAATIPLLNLAAFGYLMEVQGRVGRSGRFRTAFYLLPLARRMGIVLLAVTLWLLPIKFLAGFARDSWLLAPGSFHAWLGVLLLIVSSVLVASHLIVAIACGGGGWQFLRPINNMRKLLHGQTARGIWQDSQRWMAECFAAIQPLYHLRLGVIGYVAAYFWLVVPTILFTMLDDVTSRWQLVGFVVGCAALTLSLMWLPLLMAHIAAEGRVKATLDCAAVFQLAARAPLCWALSTAVLLACSVLPMLYTALFKIQIPPHQARWDLMVVFLVCVVPARVLVGWVYHLAKVRPATSRGWPAMIWQGVVTLGLFIGVGYYVYFLYLAETGGELGQMAVWQFPSVLQPFPF